MEPTSVRRSGMPSRPPIEHRRNKHTQIFHKKKTKPNAFHQSHFEVDFVWMKFHQLNRMGRRGVAIQTSKQRKHRYLAESYAHRETQFTKRAPNINSKKWTQQIVFQSHRFAFKCTIIKIFSFFFIQCWAWEHRALSYAIPCPAMCVYMLCFYSAFR